MLLLRSIYIGVACIWYNDLNCSSIRHFHPNFSFIFFSYLFWGFLNIFYPLCYYSCPISPHYSPLLCIPPPTHIPPLSFMSMGHTYKFFGFYISYTILTLLLSIFYLPLCYLFSVPFPPSPHPTPLLITLHVISISVILFLY